MDPRQTPEKNIVIISGPAGSGKDTLIDRVLEELPFQRVVTTTSRPKRENETDGIEYYFLSPEEFVKRIHNNEFVEYSQNENGAYYGVEQKHLTEAFAQEKKLLWKVDWKGALTLKEKYPEVKTICIMASEETLGRRLRSREGASYTEAYFLEREAYAKEYFHHVGDYDYVIWNEDGHLTESIKQLKELLTKITGA